MVLLEVWKRGGDYERKWGAWRRVGLSGKEGSEEE